MHAAVKNTPRDSTWTPERRRKHSLGMRRWKPWTRSTGPKTLAGKAVSSRNALKHGSRATPFTAYRTLLKHHSALLSNLLGTVKLTRKYRYYAVSGCANELQKLILAKGLDDHKKMGANELLALAIRHRLIRFPKRWKSPYHAGLDRIRRKCEKFREFLSWKG